MRYFLTHCSPGNSPPVESLVNMVGSHPHAFSPLRVTLRSPPTSSFSVLGLVVGKICCLLESPLTSRQQLFGEQRRPRAAY